MDNISQETHQVREHTTETTTDKPDIRKIRFGKDMAETIQDLIYSMS